MSLCAPLAAELQHEAATTRRMLERLPEGSFDWKPHDKSTPLGRLAGHVAELPTLVETVLTRDEMNFDPETFQPFIPATTAELVERFDRNVAAAVGLLKNHGGEGLGDPWRLRSGEYVIFELPRGVVLRSMMLNHFVHHRGQLSVYMRLLDVPLPSIYGPSADEGPGS